MRQIELIKGYPDNISDLEELVNESISKTNGRIIYVTESKEVIPETGKSRPCVIYTIEYDTDVGSWANLFNYVSRNSFLPSEMYKAFFKLDDPFLTEETINTLVDAYIETGVVNYLCDYANIEYKQEFGDEEEWRII